MALYCTAQIPSNTENRFTQRKERCLPEKKEVWIKYFHDKNDKRSFLMIVCYKNKTYFQDLIELCTART